jgi:uncharacterized protein YndB with AHSA1/START domain
MSVISVEKDFDSLSLILVAEFDAPIERVWQLWADPRQLERWWGPPTHPAAVDQHELAAGGEVTYVMTGPEGEKSRGNTPTTAVDMRLTDHDGGTRMQLRFVFESREHIERLERWRAFEVFAQSVGQMDALLAADITQPHNPAQEAR